MAEHIELLDKTMAYAKWLCQPIRQKSIFLFGKDSQGILVRLYDSFCQLPASQGYCVYLSISGSSREKELREQGRVPLIPWEEEECFSLLACSVCVISDTKAPAYFMRRDSQAYWCFAKVMGKGTLEAMKKNLMEVQAVLRIRLRNYLQCSHIVVSGADDIRILQEDYRLGNLYQGLVYEIPELWQEDGPVTPLRDMILRQDTQDNGNWEVRLEADEKKHRVLIQADWIRDRYLKEWLPVWLDYLDGDKYDVTIVVNNPKELFDNYCLSRLSRKARVLTRTGYLLADAAEREDVLDYSKNFWLMDQDEREAKGQKAMEIYRQEWKRVFGCAGFDIIIFSSLMPQWYLGIQPQPARKIFLCSREMGAYPDNREEQCQWEHKWDALQGLDGVFRTGAMSCPEGHALARVPALPRPIPWQWADGDGTGQPEIIHYQNKEYALLYPLADSQAILGQVEFIPLPPADGTAYVAAGEIDSVLPGFLRLKEQDPRSLLYVFIGEIPCPESVLEGKLQECVIPIGETACAGMPGGWGYFSRFCGCLVASDAQGDFLASWMALLGKPVYVVENGQIQQKAMQTNKESLYAWGKESVNRIWEGYTRKR